MRTIRDQLTADEIGDYEAFYTVEPWGGVPDDLRAALIAFRVCTALGAKGSFGDFVPSWEPKPVLSFADGAAVFAAWATAHNRSHTA